MKPTKCPAREKKWGKKSEKRGEERKRKLSKSQDCCVTFKPKNYLAILFFVHAQNFVSLYFASGSEGLEVYDLYMGLW